MRKKQVRFVENKDHDNIIEEGKSSFSTIKGNWKAIYFKNDNPIILELGCGRGDYTVGLAQKYPDKNFVGVDIKGDRIWYGSTLAQDYGLQNVAFLRAEIELLDSFFAPQEISEIWITFPGPRPKKTHAKKRLTSTRFLELYKTILQPNGIVHLKTDSELLFEYTSEVLEYRTDIVNIHAVSNLYESSGYDEVKSIQTHFEKRYLKQGKSIKYVQFSFSHS